MAYYELYASSVDIQCRDGLLSIDVCGCLGLLSWNEPGTSLVQQDRKLSLGPLTL